MEVKVVCDGKERLAKQICLKKGDVQLKCAREGKPEEAKPEATNPRLGASSKDKSNSEESRVLVESIKKLSEEVSNLRAQLQCGLQQLNTRLDKIATAQPATGTRPQTKK